MSILYPVEGYANRMQAITVISVLSETAAELGGIPIEYTVRK